MSVVGDMGLREANDDGKKALKPYWDWMKVGHRCSLREMLTALITSGLNTARATWNPSSHLLPQYEDGHVVPHADRQLR